MQVWQQLYTIAGAASASLTGLVFLALSMHRDVIARHSGYRSVALQTVIAFINILMVAPLEHRVLWLAGTTTDCRAGLHSQSPLT